MKFALLSLTLLLLGGTPVEAALPEGKVAVIRITATESLADAPGIREIQRTRNWIVVGSGYGIDRSQVASLDGVQTLLLIDRKTVSRTGNGVQERHVQEARALGSLAFTVEDLPGKVLNYRVASIGGDLRLLGDGDQILVQKDGYHIWKVEGVDLVDTRTIVLQ